jgi:hypothetical protein
MGPRGMGKRRAFSVPGLGQIILRRWRAKFLETGPLTYEAWVIWQSEILNPLIV